MIEMIFSQRHLSLRVLTLASVMLQHGFAFAGGVTIHKHDAVAWSQNLVINGGAGPAFDRVGLLLVNGASVPFAVASPADTFSVPIHLGEGVNAIVARVDSAGTPVYSDTLRLTLGYNVRPEIFAYATVVGREVRLHAAIVTDDDSSAIFFEWSPDDANPVALSLSTPQDSVSSCTLAADAPLGEYYFNVVARSSHGDTTRARTLVTADSAGIRSFDIRFDHSRWIDSAIVYGVTPSVFVASGQFANITAKIPELAQLGVTALWIQPVYSTHEGDQGYDVVDYFNIRGDVGSESSLRTLVQTAHASGLRVLLDFVPNHTSIYHPYALDASQYGPTSHYFDFYQRVKDVAPYSSNENVRTVGAMTFIYYFWEDLPNLNYDNPEVQRMIIEAGKYWVERLDIDGYRVDAVWAVNARRPEFMQEWRLALKRVKPEILLLAEDKASVVNPDPSGRPSPYVERFDAAYDWTREESWVSHWVWQSYYSASSNPTIFNNTAEAQRGAALRNSLTNSGAGYDTNAIIFRFMENNDTFRFLATHDLARTKMAAALLFSLPGIPLIFNGQEIGASTHPYNTVSIFLASATIKSRDTRGLFPYYQQLSSLRKRFPALASRHFQEITITPSASEYAYRKWAGNQNVIVCINMAGAAFTSTVAIPASQLALDSSKTYYLTDMISGQAIVGTPDELTSSTIPMPAYTTRMFVLADSVANVTAITVTAGSNLPTAASLAQNYPNPFNPTTAVSYQLSAVSEVRLVVYDVLGREVATLVDGMRQPGTYTVWFDGSNIASGLYFYRMETKPVGAGTHGAASFVKKMLLLK
jgi:glycosidase